MTLDWFRAGNVESLASGSAPTISLTAPANGASLPLSEPVTLIADAQATEPGAAIEKVEFFEDSTKLGEDAEAPYEFVWSGAGAGAHTVKAVATDSNGARATSEPVTFTLVDGMFQTKMSFTVTSFQKIMALGRRSILVKRLPRATV